MHNNCCNGARARQAVIAAMLLVAISGSQAATLPSFEMRGQVRSSVARLTATNSRMMREFTAWGDGKRWQITLWNDNLLSTNKGYIYHGKDKSSKTAYTNVFFPYWIAAGGRGEDFYCGMYDRVNSNKALVWITTNAPPGQFDRMSASVWLALGTVTYEGAAPDLPPPFPPYGRLYETEDGGKFRARWSRFEEPPHFVQRITYMNRGYMLTPHAKGGDEQIPYGGAYRDGFQELVLQAQSTTNIGPYKFPLRYEFTRYAPGDASTGSGGLRSMEFYVIEVFDIKLGVPPREFPLPMLPRLLVNDHRLAGDTNIGVMSYSIPDGRWRTVAEAKKIHEMRKRQKVKPVRQPWVFGLLLALVCAPMLIFTLTNWRAKANAAKSSASDGGPASQSGGGEEGGGRPAL